MDLLCNNKNVCHEQVINTLISYGFTMWDKSGFNNASYSSAVLWKEEGTIAYCVYQNNQVVTSRPGYNFDYAYVNASKLDIVRYLVKQRRKYDV